MSGARFIRIISLGKKTWLKQFEEGDIVTDDDFIKADLFNDRDVAMITSLARCVCGTAEIQLFDQDKMSGLIETEAKALEDRAAEMRRRLEWIHDDKEPSSAWAAPCPAARK